MPIDTAALFAILAAYYHLLCKFSENRKKIAPFGCFEGEEGNDEDLQKEVQAFEKEVTESLHRCLCDECHEKNDKNYTAEECSRHNSDNVDFEWEMVPVNHGVILAPFDGFMRGYSTFFVVTHGTAAGKMYLHQMNDPHDVFYNYAKEGYVNGGGMDYMEVDWEKVSNVDMTTFLRASVWDLKRSGGECSFLGRVERGV